MNLMQSPSVKNAANFVPFSHPWSNSRQNRFRVEFSCKAAAVTEDFQKEISALDFKDASVDQIKRTYRKLALQYHPDVCDPTKKEESTRMFIELQKTYKTLLDKDSQMTDNSDESKNKWENQLSELKRRPQKEGSWGGRMRANQQYP